MMGEFSAGPLDVRRWWPDRQRYAACAVLAALLTGVVVAALGGSGGHAYGAAAYVAITVAALLFPAGITVQVIAGQVLAGSLLLGPDAGSPLLLLPIVASVVATAELLAIVARLDAPFARDPGEGLHRVGLASAVGGAVFGVVVLIGGLPGPTGTPAVALATGACVLLAILLVRQAR